MSLKRQQELCERPFCIIKHRRITPYAQDLDWEDKISLIKFINRPRLTDAKCLIIPDYTGTIIWMVYRLIMWWCSSCLMHYPCILINALISCCVCS